MAGVAQAAPADVCALVQPATIAAALGAATAGTPTASGSCAWTAGGIRLTVRAAPASSLASRLSSYQRDHTTVDAPPNVASAALLAHDGDAWGVALAENGLWFEVDGAPTRQAALAVAGDLAEAARR